MAKPRNSAGFDINGSDNTFENCVSVGWDTGFRARGSNNAFRGCATLGPDAVSALPELAGFMRALHGRDAPAAMGELKIDAAVPGDVLRYAIERAQHGDERAVRRSLSKYLSAGADLTTIGVALAQFGKELLQIVIP